MKLSVALQPSILSLCITGDDHHDDDDDNDDENRGSCTNCGADRPTDDDGLCHRCRQLPGCKQCGRHLPHHCFSAEQIEICQVLFKFNIIFIFYRIYSLK